MSNITRWKYYFVFIVYFIIFGAVVAAVTSYVNFRIDSSNAAKQVNRNAESIFNEKSFYLKQIVRRYSLLLNTFSDSKLLTDYIDDPREHNTDHLAAFFFASVESTINLSQLRYIDASGMERVRVDRVGDRVLIVGEDKLRNRRDTYYFREASSMSENAIWKSRFHLSIEDWKTGDSIEPTYGMATPVYHKGGFKGIILVNLSVDTLLQSLIKAQEFEVVMCDGTGEVLMSSDHSANWSRYSGKDIYIRNLMPKDADKILKNDVYKGNNVFSFNLEPALGNGENLRMVFSVKSSFMSDMKSDNSSAALIIALTVLAVSIPLSWVAAYIPSKLQSRLTQTNRQLKAYNDIMDEHVITVSTDMNQVITRVSSAFARITGYSAEELIGKTNGLIRHPENDPKIYQELWDTISKGKIWKGELRCVDKNGGVFWLKKIITPDLDEDGIITGFTSIDYDFTAAKIIEEMSVTDQLTKISNRRWLDESLKEEIARYDRYNHDFSIILLDIDHFKNVNDTFGHAEGDSVLIQLAEILKTCTRASDTVGRWGGEEFLIIAPGTLKDDCFVLAEKIRHAVEDHDFGAVGHVTVSLGVAQYESGSTAAHFIINADNALYRAKQGGRNRTEKA
ncbi:sensor domain-containing diguanylate cyclase [Seleniivibrio woodruffii]|uniref:sensor domain-containing diguanylate cyclase n=1 Tax=Seleniivibrio woodruffii TaxID=1078050 RepID=UPI00240A92B6|nr:diguanylate cyclase [Seleniivibrio woodruffii]